jgi:acetyl esterase/lipase
MAAADGLCAIEVVRQHAAEWRLDPAHVGIMGFSAGGYVAVQAALDHTAANRPAFVAAIYTCCENAPELKIPEDAPPIFFLRLQRSGIRLESLAFPGMESRQQAGRVAHLLCWRPWLRHTQNTTSPLTIGSNASATGSGTRN